MVSGGQQSVGSRPRLGRVALALERRVRRAFSAARALSPGKKRVGALQACASRLAASDEIRVLPSRLASSLGGREYGVARGLSRSGPVDRHARRGSGACASSRLPLAEGPVAGDREGSPKGERIRFGRGRLAPGPAVSAYRAGALPLARRREPPRLFAFHGSASDASLPQGDRKTRHGAALPHAARQRLLVRRRGRSGNARARISAPQRGEFARDARPSLALFGLYFTAINLQQGGDARRPRRSGGNSRRKAFFFPPQPSAGLARRRRGRNGQFLSALCERRSARASHPSAGFAPFRRRRRSLRAFDARRLGPLGALCGGAHARA